MGYLTCHYLAVVPEELAEQVRDALEKESGYGGTLFDEPVTWYDRDDTCEFVSTKFPLATITIRGQGEDDGDTWIEHWHNGRVRFARREPWKAPTADEFNWDDQ